MSIDLKERILILEKLNQIKKRKNEQDDFLLFCKKSSKDYVSSWVHIDICRRLEKFARDVREKKSPRLMMFMPPRHGKSFHFSERFPAWVMGKYSNLEYISTSYGQTLSEEFSGKCRDLIKEDFIRDIFPDFNLRKDYKSLQKWKTTNGGSFIAGSVDSGITGKGGHIISIDDPHKNGQEALSDTMRNKVIEWYKSTVFTRRYAGGGILIIQTRWHEDDLAGYLLRTQKNVWEVVCYPAIATQDEKFRKKGEALFPELYPLEFLKEQKETLGEYNWNAQYQQDPLPVSGTLFKAEDWRYYQNYFDNYDRVIQVWDFSFKGDDDSDYTVGQVWAKKGANFYLLDQVRGKWEFPEQIVQVQLLSKKHPQSYAKYIEDKANGSAVISLLKNKISGLIPFNPRTDKISRALVVQPFQQAGNLFLPNSQLNPWVNEYVSEHSKFPRAKHDDQVDCTALAIIQLSKGSIDNLRSLVS
ncbi:MAG: terminase [Spirobacillus cienkowskii]|jgi:predicted phage terminase large subunit-like protein|uniref:Terminase n=1 Tax=Spirobacillus cienkowskii TaxID=495820 RepID=A0A369L1G0_9BACT|nr:MAG: terminase [Spirobacillus cienkowskii]